jgi:hypothetical protein
LWLSFFVQFLLKESNCILVCRRHAQSRKEEEMWWKIGSRPTQTDQIWSKIRRTLGNTLIILYRAVSVH